MIIICEITENDPKTTICELLSADLLQSYVNSSQQNITIIVN